MQIPVTSDLLSRSDRKPKRGPELLGHKQLRVSGRVSGMIWIPGSTLCCNNLRAKETSDPPAAPKANGRGTIQA